MAPYLLGFFIFFIFQPSFSQDERFFRNMFDGTLPKLNDKVSDKKVLDFKVSGKSYLIDLDGDGIEEFIIPQKRDGIDWVEIKDSSLNILFETPLFAMGVESYLYKIKFVKISPTVKVLILFLDEGKTEGKIFESTAKFYLLTIEDNNLRKVKVTSGPHFFLEKSGLRDIYYRRDYQVSVKDLNRDGIKEIVLVYGQIQRILQYSSSGNWIRY